MNASGRNRKVRKTVTDARCGDWGLFLAAQRMLAGAAPRDACLSWPCQPQPNLKVRAPVPSPCSDLQEYLDSFPGDRAALGASDVLANRLLNSYRSNHSSDWNWFENSLAYSNARLPQALIRAGMRAANDEMVAAGLRSLGLAGHDSALRSEGPFRAHWIARLLFQENGKGAIRSTTGRSLCRGRGVLAGLSGYR